MYVGLVGATSQAQKETLTMGSIAAGAYPGFCSMKRLGVLLLLLDGMLDYTIL